MLGESPKEKSCQAQFSIDRRKMKDGHCKWLTMLCGAGIDTKCLEFNSYIKNPKDRMDNEVVTLSVRSQLFRFIKTAEEDFRRD